LQRGLELMPETLKDLRRRIGSIKNTQQITEAMRLVSTAKLGRAQNSCFQARPYLKAIQTLMADLGATTPPQEGLFATVKSSRVFIVVVSSERGLCGGFNAYIAKKALLLLKSLEEENLEPQILCLGKKAYQSMSRLLETKGYAKHLFSLSEIEKLEKLEGKVIIHLQDPLDKHLAEYAQVLVEEIERLYLKERVGQLWFVRSLFRSAGNYEVVDERMLPLKWEEMPTQVRNLTIDKPLVPFMRDVAPRYLRAQVHQMFLESLASEHGARMVAMENATRNAKEMLRSLQIRYQRARQASITKELIEIISGAEAL